MAELFNIIDHRIATLINFVLVVIIFIGGFIWVEKKQSRQRGFLYKLLLVLQIFFWPFEAFSSLFSIVHKLQYPLSLGTLGWLIAIVLAIHGAYWGVKLLKVTDAAKNGMKLNLLLRFVMVLIYFVYSLLRTKSEDGTLSDVLPDYWITFYAMPILVLAFLFAYYQFVITLKNDEPDTGDVALPRLTNE